MSGGKKAAAWVSAVVIGLALVGFGMYLAIADLDRADKLASVTGPFLAATGLAMSGYGIILARRALQSSNRSSGQTVERVRAKSGVDVVDGVGGSVHLGPSQIPSPSAGKSTASAPPQPSGEQTVRDVQAGGHVRIIRGVGGDVDSAS
jgi:hypothetical protein